MIKKWGLSHMKLFDRKKKPVELPPALMADEDPVNFNSVLDYLVGLSKPEFDKLLKVTNVHRDANKESARILGIKDEPTTTIKTEKPSEEEIDEALDQALAGTYEPTGEVPPVEPPKKPNAATAKKVEVK